jgi:hypothetical protein
MDVQPYTIDTEAEARAYLSDLLQKPENRSMAIIESHCTRLVGSPGIKALFMAAGAEMLTKLQGQT